MLQGWTRTAAAAAVLLTLAGCDNPVSQEVHTEATGIVLLLGGNEVVRVSEGVVSGGVAMTAGTQTGMLTVRFLDAEGHETEPRSGYFLEVESSAPAVATWVPESPGAFTGRIAALAVGTAQLEFRYMHGRVGSANAHRDASAAVTVDVAAAAGAHQPGEMPE